MPGTLSPIPTVPAPFQAGWIALTVLMFICLMAAVRSGLRQMNAPAAKRNKVLILLGGWFALWLSVNTILSLRGFFTDFSTVPPRMVLNLAVPTLTLIVLVSVRRFREIIRHIPPVWLTVVQVFRIPVEILLWLQVTRGITPEQMSFEGYNFDIIAGITAPVVSLMCFSGGRYWRKLALLWNVLSLGLLMNILIIAILSIPSPFRQFMNEPANSAIATWPFVWLAAFLAPLAMYLHVFSFIRLSRRNG